MPKIGASEALSRRHCSPHPNPSPHPKPSPLFPLDLSAAFIKPDFRESRRIGSRVRCHRIILCF
ncbi:hypothetical protein Scep_014621 [Stephania cephalantha]|uniref:Uncharacterized protein n=1 Tax=Stephania cephalantha TaxID=152367 RepID=A0AAP0J2Z4_9MAGN